MLLTDRGCKRVDGQWCTKIKISRGRHWRDYTRTSCGGPMLSCRHRTSLQMPLRARRIDLYCHAPRLNNGRLHAAVFVFFLVAAAFHERASCDNRATPRASLCRLTITVIVPLDRGRYSRTIFVLIVCIVLIIAITTTHLRPFIPCLFAPLAIYIVLKRRSQCRRRNRWLQWLNELRGVVLDTWDVVPSI